jgi:hypothetical protein
VLSVRPSPCRDRRSRVALSCRAACLSVQFSVNGSHESHCPFTRRPRSSPAIGRREEPAMRRTAGAHRHEGCCRLPVRPSPHCDSWPGCTSRARRRAAGSSASSCCDSSHTPCVVLPVHTRRRVMIWSYYPSAREDQDRVALPGFATRRDRRAPDRERAVVLPVPSARRSRSVLMGTPVESCCRLARPLAATTLRRRASGAGRRCRTAGPPVCLSRRIVDIVVLHRPRFVRCAIAAASSGLGPVRPTGQRRVLLPVRPPPLL